MRLYFQAKVCVGRSCVIVDMRYVLRFETKTIYLTRYHSYRNCQQHLSGQSKNLENQYRFSIQERNLKCLRAGRQFPFKYCCLERTFLLLT